MVNRQIRDLWIISVLRVAAWIVLVGGLATAVLTEAALTSSEGVGVPVSIAVGSIVGWVVMLGMSVSADLSRATHEEIVRSRVEAQEDRRSS